MGSFLQGNELLIILVILLLILGPTKLPALAKGLGQAIREFRKAAQGDYDNQSSSAAGGITLTTKEVEQLKGEKEFDRAVLEKIAEKLGVESSGKSDRQLYNEIVEKAKDKKLI